MSIVKTAKKYSQDHDNVYCFFDKDHQNENFEKAIQFCAKYGFIPIISNPCIELWFLKHYVVRQSALGGPKQTLKALLKHFPSYDKDGVIAFYETYPNLKKACIRASKLDSRKDNHYHRDPFTNVDILVSRFYELDELKTHTFKPE